MRGKPGCSFSYTCTKGAVGRTKRRTRNQGGEAGCKPSTSEGAGMRNPAAVGTLMYSCLHVLIIQPAALLGMLQIRRCPTAGCSKMFGSENSLLPPILLAHRTAGRDAVRVEAGERQHPSGAQERSALLQQAALLHWVGRGGQRLALPAPGGWAGGGGGWGVLGCREDPT